LWSGGPSASIFLPSYFEGKVEGEKENTLFYLKEGQQKKAQQQQQDHHRDDGEKQIINNKWK